MKAAIDIGTNTVLILVAEYENDRIKILYEEQCVPRLGQGVDQSGQISDEGAQRVIDVLKHYKNLLAREYPELVETYATATSAVRDAKNKSEFLQKIAETTGFNIWILSGNDEAYLTFLGALSVLNDQSVDKENLVLDIGGGSTELAFGHGHKLVDRHSFDMGCVRFTERFLKNDPPDHDQIEACRKAIRQMLDSYVFEMSNNTSLIGVAGTATSLAFIDKGMQIYKSEKLTGHSLLAEKVADYVQHFTRMSSEHLKKQYPVVMEGRADIFLTGLLILEQVMKAYNFDQVTISTGGIRHGIILDSFDTSTGESY